MDEDPITGAAFVSAEGGQRFFRIVPAAGHHHSDLVFTASSSSVLAIALTFALAGIVKGVTGMGLPTVAMGVLGTMMPPVAAAALLIVPSFVTNAWQVLAGARVAAVASRLSLMMWGIAAGTMAGTWMLTGGHVGGSTTALGAALMVYAAFSLLAGQLLVPARWERGISPVIGVMTGVIAGGTGVFVIPAVPYLQALGLSKDDLVQALGLSFTVSTVALAAGLAWGGALRFESLTASSAATVPALAGMWVGQRVRARIGAATFRRWFLIGLLLLGLELALRPWL
jgi:uncharacterized membrane protein YfcA